MLRYLRDIVELANRMHCSRVGHFLLPFLAWSSCIWTLTACQPRDVSSYTFAFEKHGWDHALKDLLAMYPHALKRYTDEDADRYVANGLRYLLFKHREKNPRVQFDPKKDIEWMYMHKNEQDVKTALTEGIDDVFQGQEKRARRWRFVPLVESFDHHGQPQMTMITWHNNRIPTRSPDLLRLDYFGNRAEYAFFLPTALVRPKFHHQIRFKTVYTFPSAFIHHVPEADQVGLNNFIASKREVWIAGLEPSHQMQLRYKWSNFNADLLRRPKGSSRDVNAPPEVYNFQYPTRLPAQTEHEFVEHPQVGQSSHSATDYAHQASQHPAVQLQPQADSALASAYESGPSTYLPLEYRFQRTQSFTSPYQPPMDPSYVAHPYQSPMGPSYSGHPYQLPMDPSYMHQYRSIASSSNPSYIPPEEHLFMPGASRTGVDEAQDAELPTFATPRTGRSRSPFIDNPPDRTSNED